MTLKLITARNDKNGILSKDLRGIVSTIKNGNKYNLSFTRLCRIHKGAGLAAPQIGLEENMFYVAPSVKILGVAVGELCINPSYTVAEGVSHFVDFEGCLSLPHLRFKVKRPTVITATWLSLSGRTESKKLIGIAARVFMHEYDHLSGITLMQSGVLIAKRKS